MFARGKGGFLRTLTDFSYSSTSVPFPAVRSAVRVVFSKLSPHVDLCFGEVYLVSGGEVAASVLEVQQVDPWGQRCSLLPSSQSSPGFCSTTSGNQSTSLPLTWTTALLREQAHAASSLLKNCWEVSRTSAWKSPWTKKRSSLLARQPRAFPEQTSHVACGQQMVTSTFWVRRLDTSPCARPRPRPSSGHGQAPRRSRSIWAASELCWVVQDHVLVSDRTADAAITGLGSCGLGCSGGPRAHHWSIALGPGLAGRFLGNLRRRRRHKVGS